MKRLIPAVGLLLYAAVSPVSAELLYEPFNYAAATTMSQVLVAVSDTNPLLNGSNGNGPANPYGPTWFGATNVATHDNIAVTAGNLTVPAGLPAPVGNKAEWSSNGAAARIGIGPFTGAGTGSTVYYSFAVSINDLANLQPSTSAGGNILAGFNTVQGPQSSGVPSVIGARLLARLSPTTGKYVFGFSKNSALVADVVWETVDRDLNTSYFVVGSYTLVGSGDDSANLWISPDAANFGAAAAPQPTIATGPGAASGKNGADISTGHIESFMLRQSGPTGTPAGGIQVDELRVDTSWAGVTPKAGSDLAAGGNWGDAGTWSASGVPDAASAAANLRPTADTTVTTAAAGHQINRLTFGGTGNVTINGNGALALSNGASINVERGSHTISATVTLASDLSANVAPASSVTVTGDLSGNVHLRKTGFGTLAASKIAVSQLSIFEGTVKLTGTAADPSSVTALTLPRITHTDANGNGISPAAPPHGTLDLGTGAIVVNYAGTTAFQADSNEVPSVASLIKQAYKDGVWNGPGVTSSAAATSQGTAVGWAENSVLGKTDFNGVGLDGTSVVARFTWLGDANLDGVVDSADRAIFDANVGTTGKDWARGDFNFDGAVNQDDLAALELGAAVSGGQNISAVPEPGAIGAGTVIAAVSLLSRRRTRRSVK